MTEIEEKEYVQQVLNMMEAVFFGDEEIPSVNIPEEHKDKVMQKVLKCSIEVINII